MGGELALFRQEEEKQQKKPRGVKMCRKNKLTDKDFIMVESTFNSTRLLMRGSDHGFTREAFKSRILDRSLGPLIILVKSESG